MPDPEISRRVDGQLRMLYERHHDAPADADLRYYEPGRGYHRRDAAGDSHRRFGIAVAFLDGALHGVGDDTERFALQSISKVFAYALALEDHGRDGVLRHVGVEPSGDAFNSLQFDEHRRRPYNPMVNAGALVTSALARGRDHDEKLARILDLVQRCADNPQLESDPVVFEREFATADRNRAAGYFLRSEGMLDGDVEDILALYLQQCSIVVTARDVAMMGATLAGGGVNPATGEQVLAASVVRDVLTVMYTCGMYDFAGEWAFEVGVPAKSGVSGAILAAIPGKAGIGVHSPGLDRFGNSVRGIRVLRDVSDRLGLHLFADDSQDAMLRPGA
jgi:glutaminase